MDEKEGQEELEQLRRDNEALRSANEDLRWKVSLFATEHRFAAKLAGLLFLGPRLAESIRRWMLRATKSNPFPLEESSALGAAIIRRIIAVGVIGLLFPMAPLLYQNHLISDQNRYFREQTEEIRKQIAVQEEQGDLVRRAALIEVVFDGKSRGLSMRTREEALEALVALDNKLADRGILSRGLVDLKGLDFSCEEPGQENCADLRSSWLPRVDFSGAKLQGADFSYSDLRESSFVRADLRDASFVGAQLEGVALRENLPPTLHFSMKGHLPNYIRDSNTGITAEELKELRHIYLTQVPKQAGVEAKDYFEFALERTTLPEGLSSSVNRFTGAANLRGAKFSFRAERGVELRGFGHSEQFYNIDHFTRLPMGLARPARRAAIEAQREAFKRIDKIQLAADELFGPFKVNVNLGFGPEDLLLCTSRESTVSTGLTIEQYEKLSQKEQKISLQDMCAPGEVRMRGWMPSGDSLIIRRRTLDDPLF